ncbi:hypothetical protein GEV33_008128 [Tenebrio molitor]|uniref:Uncharacterized protein n=1 Tax=Tenebrio molitor TaxID=7067 RepID=A0A8J6HHU8_TENMO|nr:hypothetical protein GEV33_008128 [Tenebrio molitor]
MKFPRAADDTCTSSARYERERSDLSLLRRPSASCGVRGSAVLLPLRLLLIPVEMKKRRPEKQETRRIRWNGSGKRSSPTPSIIDENRRSRRLPGVLGDEESSVKEVQGREGEGNLWSWCQKKGKAVKKEEDRKERNFSGEGPRFAT